MSERLTPQQVRDLRLTPQQVRDRIADTRREVAAGRALLGDRALVSLADIAREYIAGLDAADDETMLRCRHMLRMAVTR